MAPIATRGSRTPSRRILVSIKDQKPNGVGRYAGWGEGDDLKAPAGKAERAGLGMMPFLRYRASDRWWRVGIGFLWVPAIIAVITVEDWLHLSEGLMWTSLGVLFVGFIAFLLFWDSRKT